MTKPDIVIEFQDDGTVMWFSDGWKYNKELMAAAKKAINDGNDPNEVRELLGERFNIIEK